MGHPRIIIGQKRSTGKHVILHVLKEQNGGFTQGLPSNRLKDIGILKT